MRGFVSIMTAAMLATHMLFGCCDADCCDRHDECVHDHCPDCPESDGERPAHDRHHCSGGGCAFLLNVSTSIDPPDVLPLCTTCPMAGPNARGPGDHSRPRTARHSDPPPPTVPLFLALRMLLI